MTNSGIEMANLLLPNVDWDFKNLEKFYPPRQIFPDAMVTRFAPSPTGFLHIGGVYTALISKKAANQTNGVFILRIEDTDKKREIKCGTSQLISQLQDLNITFDEGMIDDFQSTGNYGPYLQSQRKEIYHCFVKYLLVQGIAYPCFCSPSDLDLLRIRQENAKQKTGYYENFAIHRNITLDEVKKYLAEGKEFVIRFKNYEQTQTTYHDLIKKDITLTEHIDDIVLMKTDGLPTYHLAHVADDFLMRVTHVLRADEWLPSLPLHLKLFMAFGITPPKYGHISPILKLDGTSKRKLSKRKDPEASVEFYHSKGYPPNAVLEYLLNIANSDFEYWRMAHSDEPYTSFVLNINKMNASGALFDVVKLKNISKDYISKMNNIELYNEVLKWAEKYNARFYDIILRNKTLTLDILSIGRNNTEKKRKDYSNYSDVVNLISYFYDSYFNDKSETYQFPIQYENCFIATILNECINVLNPYDTNEEWFEKVKDISKKFNFAINMSDYSKNKEKYIGSVADVASFLRIAITKRTNSFDLYQIIRILGIDRIKNRLGLAIKYLNEQN